MSAAFDWSPGGCCCEVAPPYWAMGVDDIDNPTQTRIPRIAKVLFTNAQFTPLQGLSCNNPAWLNNQTHEMIAYSPTYSGAFDPTTQPQGGLIQMHWTTADDADVQNHIWPGTAGKPPAPAGTGRLPSRLFATPSPTVPFVNSTGAGWLTARNHYYYLSTNPNISQGDGYPDSRAPMFRPFGSPVACTNFGAEKLQMELTLVCGRELDDPNDLIVRAYFSGALIAYSASPTRPALTKARATLTGVPFASHTFSDPTAIGGTRTQRVCVIPSTIDFGFDSMFPATSAEGNETIRWDGGDGSLTGTPGPGLWGFRDLGIHIEFDDWYTGPTVEG